MGQVGYPASMATDAQLGYSVTAYQSADILFGSREGRGSIPVRSEGTCARAHQKRKTDLSKGANVGYCPSRTKAARIAIPSRYSAGGLSKDKAQGLQLWREHGPWAARRLAACIYAKQ